MKHQYEKPRPGYFSMTWEEYHGIEKPFIKLESKINFKKGQTVMINKDNHGFKYSTWLEKALENRYVVVSIASTGTVEVKNLSSNLSNRFHYSNLIIINDLGETKEETI